MSTPQITQGTLNRLRASISFPDFPALNITPAYLGSEMINLNFSGEATTIINSATGIITSPEPYIIVEFSAHILRTNGLDEAFKAQWESLSTVNNAVIRSDSSVSSNYTILNCSITAIGEIRLDGKVPSRMITFKGYYPINQALFGA